MKVILRTSDFTENFKIVELLDASKNEGHNLRLVEYEDKTFYTGGLICRLNDTVFDVLIELSNEKQWELMLYMQFPFPD